MEYLANNWPLLLAIVFVAVFLAKDPIMRKISGYDEVEPTGATMLMNHDDALVLDVREDSEWRDGHIEGAKHIPLGKLGSHLSELEKYKDRPLIVQCRSGNRSAMACGQLKRAGFAKVYNLKGGITAWSHAGLPVIKG